MNRILTPREAAAAWAAAFNRMLAENPSLAEEGFVVKMGGITWIVRSRKQKKRRGPR